MCARARALCLHRVAVSAALPCLHLCHLWPTNFLGLLWQGLDDGSGIGSGDGTASESDYHSGGFRPRSQASNRRALGSKVGFAKPAPDGSRQRPRRGSVTSSDDEPDIPRSLRTADSFRWDKKGLNKHVANVKRKHALYAASRDGGLAALVVSPSEQLAREARASGSGRARTRHGPHLDDVRLSEDRSMTLGLIGSEAVQLGAEAGRHSPDPPPTMESRVGAAGSLAAVSVPQLPPMPAWGWDAGTGGDAGGFSERSAGGGLPDRTGDVPFRIARLNDATTTSVTASGTATTPLELLASHEADLVGWEGRRECSLDAVHRLDLQRELW